MKVRGDYRTRARIVMRKLRQKIAPGGVILLYHRVAELERDPQLLSVSPKNFRAHLEILRKIANPISMPQLVLSLSAGDVPRRAVMITFDDGYRDNFEHAKPILEEYEIPSTVFVASGYVGKRREFWWDELERIFLSPGELPSLLQLTIDAGEVNYDLGSDRRYSERDAARHAGWDVTNRICPTARHRTYNALCRIFLESGFAAREQALEILRAWACDDSVGRPTHHPMTRDEILRLAKGGLCQIGAHTISHPRLASLSLDEQESEIFGSKRELEAILDSRVSGFSYTFGGRPDYTSDTINLVRQAGFDWACSNFSEVAWRGCDSFQLPRLMVRNWNADTFLHFLKWWV